MDNVEKTLAGILLSYLLSVGLISQDTYAGAADALYSAADLPAFFGRPIRPAKEAGSHDDTPDTR